MATWLERAREKISPRPVQGTVDAVDRGSNDCNGGKRVAHFSPFLGAHSLENGPKMEKGPPRLLSLQSKETGLLGYVAEAAGGVPEYGIHAWIGSIRSFTPGIAIGDNLRKAALAFLNSEIAVQAVELDWNERELFGVLNHDDAEVITCRADAKGVVPYVALAVWPGTRLDRFAASHAVIVTGSGAILRHPKRVAANTVPFWNCNGI